MKADFLNYIISVLLITIIIPGIPTIASALDGQLGEGENFGTGSSITENSDTGESGIDGSSISLSSSSELDYNDSEEDYNDSEEDYNDSEEDYNDSEEDYNDSEEDLNDSDQYFTDDGNYIDDYSSSGFDVIGDLYWTGIDAIEPTTNIYSKELASRNVMGGYPVRFDFVENATCITDIEFDPMKTFKKTTTITEVLKDRSVFVQEPPTNRIYEYVNIWVGYKGAGHSNSLKNGLVGFKVEKAWIKDNNVNESLITLQWYNKSWVPLNTKKVGEDNNYVYFKSKTPGFSSFAITENTGKVDKLPIAYITNYGSNNISVIDTATDKVTATVNVDAGPEGVVVTPDGKTVYVANNNSSTVSVIDTETNTVKATVDVGSWPYGVAVSPDGKKAYVANREDDTVSVIDTTTNTVPATVDVGSWPYGVAVSPDGKKVYVTNYDDNDVSVIDTATNTVTATVNVGAGPDGIAVTPDGKKVYVTNFDDDNVSVIDTVTNKVTDTVDVESGPVGVAVNQAGTKVYVANQNDDTVSIIDIPINTVPATVDVGGVPSGVSVNPDGTKVYVANYYDNTVSIIDTSKNTVIDTVNIGSGPSEVAIGKFMGTVSNASSQSTKATRLQ